MKRTMIIILSLSGGGAERVVSVLASELAEKDYPISVAVYDRKENEYPISPKLIIHELEKPHGKNKIMRLINRIRELRQLVITEKPDVVIPFLAMPTVHTWMAVQGMKCEFYSTIRNNPKVYPPQFLLRTISNYITRKSDKIIIQTKEQEKYIQSCRNKCVIMPNPVKQEMIDAEYTPAEEVSTIATFGRLNKQKNHGLLIRAFKLISEEYPNVRLYIWGTGEEYDALWKLIKELGLVGRALVCGSTTNVVDELKKTDIFVLSSDYEGLPNALMEAMAVGVPCVSTNCPTGPRNLIDNKKNGLLVEIGNELRLAEALKELINNYSLRCTIGKNAKATIKRQYSPEAISEEFRRVIS